MFVYFPRCTSLDWWEEELKTPHAASRSATVRCFCCSSSTLAIPVAAICTPVFISCLSACSPHRHRAFERAVRRNRGKQNSKGRQPFRSFSHGSHRIIHFLSLWAAPIHSSRFIEGKNEKQKFGESKTSLSLLVFPCFLFFFFLVNVWRKMKLKKETKSPFVFLPLFSIGRTEPFI